MPFDPANRYYLGRLTVDSKLELDLYQAASTVREHIGTDSATNTLLNLLQEYVNAAIVQAERVRVLSERSIGLQMKQLSNLGSLLRSDAGVTGQLFDEMFLGNELLNRDVHYFLIAVDKISKLWCALVARVFSGVPAGDGEFRMRRRRAEAAWRTALKAIGFDDSRDYLEHIDEKILAGNFGGFEATDDFTERRFKVVSTGEVILVSSEPLRRAYERLIDLVRELPATR